MSELITSETTRPASGPGRRTLGVLPLVGIFFFTVSGGPFGLEESLSGAGPGLTLLMIVLIPVVFGVPNALVAAELSAAIPVNGSYYHWTKIALGRGAGFVFGAWTSIGSVLNLALYPILLVDYLATWVPDIARGEAVVVVDLFHGGFVVDLHWIVTVAFILPMAYLNYRGSKAVSEYSIGMMLAILAPFAVLAVLGIWHAVADDINVFTPFVVQDQSVHSSVAAALSVIVWLYLGFDGPSTVMGEVRDAHRTYTRALLIAVPLIITAYLLPTIAAIGSGLHRDSPADWVQGDFVVVGEELGGVWLKVLISVGAGLSLAGLFTAILLTSTRVPRALAADGYLPRWMARDSKRYDTPVGALLASTTIVIVLAAVDFSAILRAMVLLSLASILLEFAAFLVLRWRYPQMLRPVRVPGGWPGAVLVVALPTAMIGYLAWSTAVDEPATFGASAAVALLAVLLYPLCRRFAKGDRPDAEIDLSLVELGPDRFAGIGARKADG
ncbi:APC family permease [Yinghuangia soli]|uniref:APC family permease n=1 Tax=Yinghuangia soli TaxID=2908204 RepID=A0AA41Q7G6_9ACTN|nr:APC family permease [Yinghuangia soli]MCF2533014.1 APC family permease [Yinghuangia soli]